MLLSLLIVFSYFVFTNEKHFNGGTIGWAPIDPYDNSSPVDITITQSYSWTYPTIKCANNVPASTSGWSSANTNVTCVVDCSTDGGYSNAPIDILTDCTSASSSLKMMTSEKSKNVTLSADAHFYIAYRGSSWVALNDPAQSGLDWSIVTYIDLRKRSDGLINTPPVAKVVSPQYATVNKTIQIKIPVSDANAGDDVRCRWSTYTTGYRRRKRSGEEKYENYHKIAHNYKTKYDDDKETIDSRKKRQTYSSGCTSGDNCNTGSCPKTNCLGIKCTIACCDFITTTSTTTTSTTSTTKTTTTTSSSTTSTTTVTTTSSTTDSSTSTETPGIPKSTSTYPIRQAIDECADICYPGSMPNGTTLSDCTITFTGHKAGIWGARSRRRRRQLKEGNTCARTFNSRLTTFELERQTASSKIFKSNTPTKDYLINNTVDHQNSTDHIFSEDSRINLFDSAYSDEVTTMTDVEESGVSSAVTIKRISRATIQQLHDMEKLNENAKTNSKLPNHIDNTDDSQIIGRSPVTVVRVPKLNLSNQNISITSQQNTSSASSSKLSKLNQVKVTKIQRKQTTLSQRARALSADNISTIHIGKPFVVMQPLTNHSKTASIATNIKMHKDNR
ncbi:unnamed protein product, partial [Rotaria sp. Silwood1]